VDPPDVGRVVGAADAVDPPDVCLVVGPADAVDPPDVGRVVGAADAVDPPDVGLVVGAADAVDPLDACLVVDCILGAIEDEAEEDTVLDGKHQGGVSPGAVALGLSVYPLAQVLHFKYPAVKHSSQLAAQDPHVPPSTGPFPAEH